MDDVTRAKAIDGYSSGLGDEAVAQLIGWPPKAWREVLVSGDRQLERLHDGDGDMTDIEVETAELARDVRRVQAEVQQRVAYGLVELAEAGNVTAAAKVLETMDRGRWANPRWQKGKAGKAAPACITIYPARRPIHGTQGDQGDLGGPYGLGETSLRLEGDEGLTTEDVRRKHGL